MNEDLSNFQYSPILDYNYSELFKSIDYNGEELTGDSREELISIIDESIAQYTEGLPPLQSQIEESEGKQDLFNSSSYVVASVLLFTTLTMSDCLVATKYFLLAANDYDQRFMRGKLTVIQNEGFKKLYGFQESGHKKSEWGKLKPLLEHFPDRIKHQYQDLTDKLENHAKTSSWWEEERNIETHLDAKALYKSRQAEVIQSKVVIDSLKLFDTLLAVNYFLSNVHACLRNYLVDKYKSGELLPE